MKAERKSEFIHVADGLPMGMTWLDIRAKAEEAAKRNQVPADQEEKENQAREAIRRKDFLATIHSGMVLNGASDYHLGRIADPDFNPHHPIIEKLKPYFEYFIPGERNYWLFILADSGAGKTEAIHYLAKRIWSQKEYPRIGYIVLSDFLSDIMDRKTKIGNLYLYDTLIIDDFFKSEIDSMKLQDLIKRVIDFFLRTNRTIWICADIDLDTMYGKLHSEYKDQIVGRIRERCGPYMLGFNDLPDLRKPQKENV